MHLTRPIGAALVAGFLLLARAPAFADGWFPSVRSRLPEQVYPRPPDVPEDAVLESSGAVIGKVSVHRVDVFDTTTFPEEDTPLYRLVNKLHIISRESTIRKQLLFRPGDRYDANVLRESERRLRSNGYLGDARIVPVAYADGKVDLEVLTQDTWTLKPELGFGRKGGANSSSVGVVEQNFLGTGAQLSLTHDQNVDRRSDTLEYSDANLNSDHWQLDAQLADNSDGHKQSLRVERPFYALDARWATGIELRDETRTDSIYDLGQIVEQFHTHEQVATAYGGWSAGLHDGWTTRWTAGITFDERRASDLEGAPPAQILPTDHRLAYPWIGFEVAQDDFRVVRNLNKIGRIEDLGLGWHAGVRLGFATRATGSDRDALVFDGSASKGFQPATSQTWLWNAGATGRVEHGTLVDSVFSLGTRYYWRQVPSRTLYVSVGADYGVNLEVDKQLTLGGDNGLRGYPLRYRTGQGRWLLTLEERLFTDWYPFRLFAIGAAAFYDMGSVWGGSLVQATPPPGTSPAHVLRDIGVGLRVGNLRSALGTVVHIDIAHPLDGDSSISKLQFIVEAKQSF